MSYILHGAGDNRPSNNEIALSSVVNLPTASPILSSAIVVAAFSGGDYQEALVVLNDVLPRTRRLKGEVSPLFLRKALEKIGFLVERSYVRRGKQLTISAWFEGRHRLRKGGMHQTNGGGPLAYVLQISKTDPHYIAVSGNQVISSANPSPVSIADFRREESHRALINTILVVRKRIPIKDLAILSRIEAIVAAGKKNPSSGNPFYNRIV